MSSPSPALERQAKSGNDELIAFVESACGYRLSPWQARLLRSSKLSAGRGVGGRRKAGLVGPPGPDSGPLSPQRRSEQAEFARPRHQRGSLVQQLDELADVEDVAGSPPIWPYLLTPEQRKGLMVAVISGGRPSVKERPTARLLTDLHDLDLKEIRGRCRKLRRRRAPHLHLLAAVVWLEFQR